MSHPPVEIPRGVLMADLAGLELDAAEREFLLHPSLGAIILFRRNYDSPQQIAALVADIRAQRSPPLLVAVDQEGGRVQRFRQGFTELPPLLSLGRLHETDPGLAVTLARTSGCLMALELRQVGVDFSFAPVLDLADTESRVIGDRGFHAEPHVVAALARAYIQGMESAGMRATGKHFPGHGGVIEDSHLETPEDQRSFKEIWERDLLPYRELRDLLGGVMTAHVRFSTIDNLVPTYSPHWIKSVLRVQIGFQGVVFSDDLTMAGAADIGPPVERAEAALAAGCDMVLVCNDSSEAAVVAEGLLATPSYNSLVNTMAGNVGTADFAEASQLRRQIETLERFA